MSIEEEVEVTYMYRRCGIEQRVLNVSFNLLAYTVAIMITLPCSDITI